MLSPAQTTREPAIHARHVSCFVACGDGQQMLSQRAHFWLRVVGLTVILACEFGPKLWSNSAEPAPARMAAAVAVH